MRKVVIGVVLIISLIVYKALYLDSSQKQMLPDQSQAFHIDGEATATFDMEDTDGNNFKVSQYGSQFMVDGYDNNVVVFNFFGTYCPACRQEIPMLTELKQKHEEKVLIIGVSVDDDISMDQLKEFKDEMGAEFSMSIGTDRLRSLMCRTLPGDACSGIPLTVVYSKGKLQTFRVGAEELSYIEKLIDSSKN